MGGYASELQHLRGFWRVTAGTNPVFTMHGFWLVALGKGWEPGGFKSAVPEKQSIPKK